MMVGGEQGTGAERPRATVSRLPTPDLDPFTDFYRAHQPELVRIATLIVGSRPQAEDLVQDAFVRVHAKWDRIETPEPYARRAVVNACRSHLRRRVLERRHHATLETQVTDLDARELLDALERLPLRQRTVVVLRYYAGLSEREAAEAIGCPTGTVGSLLHRALARLREQIER
jgi:RNA polymerase sigma-70 factor (sigma-E family)